MNGLQLFQWRQNLRKKFYTILLCLLTAVFLTSISAWIIVSMHHQKQLKKQSLTYETFQNKLIKENTWKKNSCKEITKRQKVHSKKRHKHYKYKKEKNYDNDSGLSKIPDVNFNSLRKYNKDIYAWIQIPGIDLSYPVLQHKTLDFYYLTHNIDNSFGYPGCIFSETNTKKDFSDALTVLYGHNMKNGSMFGTLHHFDNSDLSNKPYFIHIVTPDSKIRYKIVASAIWGTKNIMSTFSNSSDGALNFFNSVTLNCSVKNTLKIKKCISDKHSKMLVLSTCGSNSNSRFLIISLKQNEWRK